MQKAKRIFLITDTKEFTERLLLGGIRKRVKGLIRLGHDTQMFSYNAAFWQTAPVMSRLLTRRWCKPYVDELLVKQIKNYKPDIVLVGFVNFLDAQTVRLARDAAPDAFFLGTDGDLWPELHKGRIQAAANLELVMTTCDGKGIQAYQNAGIRCVFMPNSCDPDVEYRYNVCDKWKSDVLFTGRPRYKHKRYPTEDTRYQLLSRLANMQGSALYGCFDRPKVVGINYLFAISGAKIGLSVNALNDIRLYHSDRLINYLSCGTFVLAKRVPDTELLFKDGVHLRYFDTVEEFADLVNWYLNHEDERIKIADAGMNYAHAEFNCEKIAKYTMDIIEKGSYIAPWTDGILNSAPKK
jgi:hypothetical protein